MKRAKVEIDHFFDGVMLSYETMGGEIVVAEGWRDGDGYYVAGVLRGEAAMREIRDRGRLTEVGK